MSHNPRRSSQTSQSSTDVSTDSEANSAIISSDQTHRRRARSKSFHSDDDILAEIDALDMSDDSSSDGSSTPTSCCGTHQPSQPTSTRIHSSTSSTAHNTGFSPDRNEDQETGSKLVARPRPQLSQKTIKIMTQLQPSHITSYGRGPGAGLHEDLASQAIRTLTEEEKEEAKLADLEKRPRPEKKPHVKRPYRRDPEQPQFDLQIKMLLLGDTGVGKTSLKRRYADEKFSSSTLSTLGVDFSTQFMEVDGKKVKCQIWDTAGQQRFQTMAPSYYRGSHGIILVYDVSDPTENSFRNVQHWMESIRKHATNSIYKVLVGNKIDVANRKVDTAQGQAAAEKYGMMYFETSAKDGTNVVKMFHTLAAHVIKNLNKEGSGDTMTKETPRNVKHIKQSKTDKNCTIQ